jgi:histidine triad (HIT) family protein
MPTECLFCRILNKELDTKLIYEDDLVIAFDDIHPKAPTHILIIPKKHIATVNDMENDDRHLLGHMTYVAKTLAQELGVAESGYRLVMNCNGDGGQVIYHIHMHLLAGKKL